MTATTDLIDRGNDLLGKRGNLLSLWQEIAENFHPMRSDFTSQWTDGQDFAAGSMSSYPFLVQRELSGAFSAMLRPTNQQWMRITVDREDELDTEGKEWLEWATGVQTRAMYDPLASFVRATKTADGDFSAFGQCVILRERDLKRQTLLYRTYHLRDTAWGEDYAGRINEVHRNWKPKLRQLASWFPGKLDPKLQSKVEKEPFREVDCRHVVIAAEDYHGETKADPAKFPWVSAYLDLENKRELRATPSRSRMYTIPRWAHMGTQYAYSPAVVIGLPEARLIQAMALTLLEAGEIAVRPPMVARSEILRNDAQLYAGGITKIDKEWDERMGKALQEAYDPAHATGISYGLEMMRDSRFVLSEAFYINKLTMPPPEKGITAYEWSIRTQEHIQQTLPLFEPLETEYNADICEGTFWDLYYAGAFGPPQNLPQSLQGADIKIEFETPISKALRKQKSSQFQEMVNLVLVAQQIDTSAGMLPDIGTALRDAIDGIGLPTDWLRDEDAFAQAVQQAQAEAEAMKAAQAMTMGAQTMEQVGKGQQAMQGAA